MTISPEAEFGFFGGHRVVNQRLAEQTQEMDFKLEGSGGSTLDDTLRKQYLPSSDE